MHFKVIILGVLVYASGLIPNARADSDDDLKIEGYYWRDYTGTIPKDALAGGINGNAKETYIGQVLHQDQLIPAKIDPDKKTVTYEWGYKEYNAKINIKILCTQRPDEFEWVDTGNQHIDKLTDKNFVNGGYEAGTKALYIGRKLLGNELVIGKVIFGRTQSTLNTTKDGVGIQHGTFQVLAYAPGNKNAQNKNDKNKSKCKQNTVIINLYN